MTLYTKIIDKFRHDGVSGLVTGARNYAVKSLFPYVERLGIHITPISYYQPIPDTRTLDRASWNNRKIADIDDIVADTHFDRISDWIHQFERAEYVFSSAGKYDGQQSFGTADAVILYCMILQLKPDRIVEIGAGESTKLILDTVQSEDLSTEITTIDPYPEDFLFNANLRIIDKKVQDVPLTEFESLGVDDILFIDSSHVLAPGSDVQYEYTQILPTLSTGVSVHIHDVYLPDDYPADWIFNMRFWTEQYILQSFLAFNNAFEIVMPAHAVETQAPGLIHNLTNTIAGEVATGPSSFWMRRIS